jgi:hypothetical protein
MRLRALVILTALAGFGWHTQAMAIGCISGGVAGAVAGHMAHHGVLGAIGGCVAGHEYNKHQKRQQLQNETNQGPPSSVNDRTQQ